MSRALAVNNLYVEVESRGIIRKISIEADEGELICVVGSTGSGKSTLLKLMTGIIPELYRGFKVYGDIRLYGLSPVEALYRGLIAYVPQDVYSFFIGSTPREELAVLGVDSFCCSDIDLDRDIESLSDGQLYRFILYSALFSGAKVITIDEPSSHIDWWSIEEVFRYIKRFVHEKKAVAVVADHKLDTIERFCDRVVELDSSRSHICTLPKIDVDPLERVAVELDDVYVSYDRVPVLTSVSISISLGDAVAFVGRNGSGKTTLLKVLTGVIRPDRGRVAFGRNSRVFLVPQNPIYWFPTGSVESVIEFFARRSRSRESIGKVLEMFHLDGKRDRDVHSLSVGEARLLSLALAYISRANIIVIDEPTLGLDCRAKVALVNAINTLLDDDTSVVVATHDLDFANLFSSLYILENGRTTYARLGSRICTAS